MDEDRRSWPIVVGITAGIVAGVAAAFVLHSIRTSDDPGINDAQEIIDRCHDKIREIEASLEKLKQPVSA